jgi:alcohol dehydrogenase, propanol-preferring
MKAMVLRKIGSLGEAPDPLTSMEVADPVPGEREILIRVSACGVCHTELDEIEGRMTLPELPLILGHQVVGKVEETGKMAFRFRPGDRVGVAWIHKACGVCEFCIRGEENLCGKFLATGRDVHGGYAELMKAPEDFAFHIPEKFTDSEAAPLLCAGAIGHRSLRLTGIENGRSLGLTGFGASAHLVLMMAMRRFPSSPVYVFARSERERVFAKELGAVWAGDTEEEPPESLDAVIDTTPAWKPVICALKILKPGGRLVINAIRKEDADRVDLLKLNYTEHLWLEKEIKSVANVTRRDVAEFLEFAAKNPILPEVREYPLEEANIALMELRNRKIRGAKVLCVGP